MIKPCPKESVVVRKLPRMERRVESLLNRQSWKLFFVTDSKQGCHLNNLKFREVKQSNPYHIFWIKDTDVRGECMKKSGGEGDEEKEGEEHQ